jgi:hypothetical protein
MYSKCRRQMVQEITNVFSQEELTTLTNLPEVLAAKQEIDAVQTGAVSFTTPLTPLLQTTLERLGVQVSDQVPMRWIKGDTVPHVDSGSAMFETTHLVYVTDSPGTFQIGESVFPIAKGTAYVFSEGLQHFTSDTGVEPRLLLGPMSETGAAVGEISTPTTISVPRGEPIYIRDANYDPDDPDQIPDIQYSTDQITWVTIAWPCTIVAVDPSGGEIPLSLRTVVQFTTGITLVTNTQYFICGSGNIQFGTRSLADSGIRSFFTIDTVEDYPGLIQNGTQNANGFSNVHVYNLYVTTMGNSTLALGGGWVGQVYYSKGAIQNYIINCYSTRTIVQSSGGIVGFDSANGGSLTLIGCSSAGYIGLNCGGIVGPFSGNNGGTITCDGCWSVGEISDPFAAGIIANVGNGSATITNCYSTGPISGNEASGIIGSLSGPNEQVGTIIIENCYSTGDITGFASGGIYGRYAKFTRIQNCYSTGSISGNNAGGICGRNVTSYNPPRLFNCYTVGSVIVEAGYIFGESASVPATCFSEADTGTPGQWSSTNANTVLTGTPSPVVGTTWVSTGINTPYELRKMGYTPYTIENITTTPSLRHIFSSTILVGGSTGAAIQSGRDYTLLQISGGSSDSYGNITINGTTGVITTTATIAVGTYTLYIRNDGSYNITEYQLTIESAEIPCCLRVVDTYGADNQTQAEVKAGLAILVNFPERRGLLSHSDVIRMKKAYAFKR